MMNEEIALQKFFHAYEIIRDDYPKYLGRILRIVKIDFEMYKLFEGQERWEQRRNQNDE